MNSVLTFYDEVESKKNMPTGVHTWHVIPSGEDHDVTNKIGGTGCSCGAETNIMPHGGAVVIHNPHTWQ